MPVLYKYLPKKYAEDLILRSKFRIGTLYGYRDIEKHGTIIGDAGEGEKSLYMDVGNEQWTSGNQPDFAKSLLNIGEGSTVGMRNITIEKSENSPDYYIYCTTEEFDKQALKDFGYNACVVIENPERFFAAITKTLRHKGKLEGIHRCQYVSRRVEHDKDYGIHPAIIKPPIYKDQKEVRALWSPFKKNIHPRTIECRDAAKYCRLLG